MRVNIGGEGVFMVLITQATRSLSGTTLDNYSKDQMIAVTDCIGVYLTSQSAAISEIYEWRSR